MNFPTLRIADLSTAHITRTDAQLAELPDFPGHLASLPPLHSDDATGPGFIVYIPQVTADFAEHRRELREFGFSDAYVDIIDLLHSQQIPYARFDRDGARVPDLPSFDW